MNAMQQQGGTHLGDGGTGGTRAAAAARQPTFTALDPQRALTDRLMEQICDGPSLGLASLVVNMIRYNIEETAVYDKYVRWCGRTGPRGPSYPNPALVATRKRRRKATNSLSPPRLVAARLLCGAGDSTAKLSWQALVLRHFNYET